MSISSILNEKKKQDESDIEQVRRLHWICPLRNNKDHSWGSDEPKALSLLRQNILFSNASHSYPTNSTRKDSICDTEYELDPLCPSKSNETKINDALAKVQRRIFEVFNKDDKLPSLIELKRLLTACRFHVPAVLARLKHTRAFKLRHGLDRILCDYAPPPVLQSHYPGGVCGVDRQGSPVSYELLGVADMRHLLACVKDEQLLKFRLWQLELISHLIDRKSERYTEEMKPMVTSMLLIMDLRGDCAKSLLDTPVLSSLGQMMRLSDHHYPGMIKEVVVLPQTDLWPELYTALKPYIPKGLKVSILGDNYQAHLLRRVPRDQLPVVFGGFRCGIEDDIFCTEELNWDAKAPNWVALTEPSFKAGLTKLRILGGLSCVVETHVPVESCTLCIESIHQTTSWSLVVWHNRIDIPKNKVYAKANVTQRWTQVLPCTVPGRYLVAVSNARNPHKPLHLTLLITVKYPATLAAKHKAQLPQGDLVDFRRPAAGWERRAARQRRAVQASTAWLNTLLGDGGPDAQSASRRSVKYTM